ncbi:hypothetical protein SCOR_24740 [Sulfidibacter corallicola]
MEPNSPGPGGLFEGDQPLAVQYFPIFVLSFFSRSGPVLLNEEQERDLVNRLIEKGKSLLIEVGTQHRDPETGLVHTQCQVGPFVLIQHQRQKLKTGSINTNGLDLWMIDSGMAKKMLSVNYMPFHIKFFQKAGKAPWIQTFLAVDPHRPKSNLVQALAALREETGGESEP